MKNTIKNKGVLSLSCFYSSLAFSQIRYYSNIEDLEKASNGWGYTLLNIAIYVAAISSIFTLIKLFKGIEQGDDQVKRVAGGWFAAMACLIIGLWLIKEFVMPDKI
jgi:hypothetical protein